MPLPTEPSALGLEWTTLQNNYEACERSALLVKLCAVVLFALGLALAFGTAVAMAITLVLWVQEAILRTGQTRLGTRLLRIEQLHRTETAEAAAASATGAFQLHTEWLASRAGLGGLLGEYASNAVRPTVAFPYAVLLLAQCAIDTTT